jgi:serine protease Do
MNDSQRRNASPPWGRVAAFAFSGLVLSGLVLATSAIAAASAALATSEAAPTATSATVTTTPASAAATASAHDPAFDQACTRARRSLVTVLGTRSHESLRTDASGRVLPARSLASGVVIDGQGHVVTTASAVRGCDAVSVRLADGRELQAILVGADEASDVALLRLPVRDAPHVTLAAVGSDAVGQEVAALGPGRGQSPRESYGVVRRCYEQPLGSLLLLTNPVYPGWSGGPALNARGEMVGLVIGRLAEAPEDWTEAGDATAPPSFAIASDDLRTLVAHLASYGRVRRGFLGVRMVQGEVVDADHPTDPFKIGVRAEAVLPGSPAEQVGVRAGDLIVGWNGETLQSPEDLMRRVEGSPPGTVAQLVWVRNDERFEGRLVVGSKPDEELLAAPPRASATASGAAATTAGPATDSSGHTPGAQDLLERVRTLRARGAAADTSRVHPG